MAYRFKLKETLPQGVRRIAVEQIAAAIDARWEEDVRPVWVHETRKGLKRVRALFRLVRSGLGDTDWKRENNDLGEIGRLLSPLRDGHVARDLLLEFDPMGDPSISEARDWLAERLNERYATEVPGSNIAPEALIDEARARLQKARKRLATTAVDGDLVDICGRGVAEAQDRGKLWLARAIAQPTDDHLHELRKCVQVVWRQTILLDAAWPEMQSTRAGVARELSQDLGEAQDLSMMIATAEQIGKEENARRQLRTFVAQCRRRQRAVAGEALPRAQRLFAEPPKALAGTLARCWSASIELAASQARAGRSKRPKRRSPPRTPPLKR